MTPQQVALFMRAMFAGPASMNPMFRFWLDITTKPFIEDHRGKGERRGRVRRNLEATPLVDRRER
jgi:hypothetical protein